ncbi:MAG: alpha-amylase, partial [Nanoarchaeota archaeon]|nr:alpha-amylase [Nanoarchaeota archaeon]
ERDLSAWLGNNMQKSALGKIYEIEGMIKNSRDDELIADWRKLQTSDHFYYMCTKWFSDGDVHKYFNPYESPYDSFIAFMNIINDVDKRLKKGDTFSPQENIGENKALLVE